MSVAAQMVIVLKAFVDHCVPLVLGHPFKFSWLDVSQTDVFHRLSPLVGGPQRGLARWIVRSTGLRNPPLICDIAARKKLGNVPSVPSFPSHIHASGHCGHVPRPQWPGCLLAFAGI